MSERGPSFTNPEKSIERPIPEVMFRGERIYLHNIDELGKRDLSTTDYENKYNELGKVVCMARDKEYATSYSLGASGKPTWYERPLTKEEIPIGVIYKISNPNNILQAVRVENIHPPLVYEESLDREFTTKSVPADQYQVIELQIMDDFVQENGHQRSDWRQALETFIVDEPTKLPEVIESVKKRIDELDEQRKRRSSESL